DNRVALHLANRLFADFLERHRILRSVSIAIGTWPRARRFSLRKAFRTDHDIARDAIGKLAQISRPRQIPQIAQQLRRKRLALLVELPRMQLPEIFGELRNVRAPLGQSWHRYLQYVDPVKKIRSKSPGLNFLF